ncbi:MAG: helix-turn-helix transcriptional regulator [Clostridia bacterium]|nr:helix-turn-helix transcriptional regulator [Clostridia bacterium]
MDKFSKNLKEIRTQKGLSQKQMAELLGVSHRTYQNYELLDSNNREPDLEMLCKISKTLDISIDYLLDLAQY